MKPIYLSEAYLYLLIYVIAVGTVSVSGYMWGYGLGMQEMLRDTQQEMYEVKKG